MSMSVSVCVGEFRGIRDVAGVDFLRAVTCQSCIYIQGGKRVGCGLCMQVINLPA